MKTSAEIPGSEIDAALNSSSEPFRQLLRFSTTGNMSHPLRVCVGRLISEHTSLTNIFQSQSKELLRIRDEQRHDSQKLRDLEAKNQTLLAEVERLSAQAGLAQ